MSIGSLRAQVGLELPKIKPGAYHSEGKTISFRVELPGFAGVISPGDASASRFSGYSLLGFGAGFKFPVPRWKSQAISTMGINLGTRTSAANKIELNAEWRYFPRGHDKDKRYDWERPWFGLGANVGYRPITSINSDIYSNSDDTDNIYNPLHAGAFLKLGVGWIAFFAEFGLTPILNRETQNRTYNDLYDYYDVGIDPNARAIRYGFVFEF